MSNNWSRRDIFKSLGSAAALSPFLPLLNASGQETLQPRRLIIMWTAHGHFMPKWNPIGTPEKYILGDGMAPLRKHQAKVNVLTGPAMTGYDHLNGFLQMWTGSECPGSKDFPNPTWPSIDQYIGKKLQGITPYPTLPFATGAEGPGKSNRMLWSADNIGQNIEPMQDMNAALQKLFGTVSGSSMSESKSIIDVINGDLKALNNKIGKADQMKIDAHLTAIRNLEIRLQKKDVAGSKPDFNKNPLYTGTKYDRLKDMEAAFDMIVASMACDLTRVASFQFSKSGNDGIFYEWINQHDEHHALTHNPNPENDVNLANTDIFFSTHIAGLLDRLDAVPEGNGTMLDNTLFVWTTELADCYSHAVGTGGTPFLTAGMGNAIKTGRWLKHAVSNDINNPPTQHNRLLVSIANLMGVGIDTYGATDRGKGPLVGF